MPAINLKQLQDLSFKSMPVTAYRTSVADAGKFMQVAIQQIPAVVKNCMVLRCEELPHLLVTEPVLSEVFGQVLQLICSSRPVNGSLYLYISCSMPATEELDLSIPMGFRPCFIQFHTNVPVPPHDANGQQSEAGEIQKLVQPFGGDFTITQLKNPGSVCTLMLAGKQL